MKIDQKIEQLKKHITSERYEKIHRNTRLRTRYLTVILEDIYYTQNLSAVIRTCDCFGIQDVYVIGNDSAARINTSVALGASKWVDIHWEKDSLKSTTIQKLKNSGYRIVATVPNAGSHQLHDFSLSDGPLALLFGRELPGLSPEVKAQADEFLRIPMYGFSDSFNISVSAGIVLYDLSTRLRVSDIPWKLSEEEAKKLEYRWIRKSMRRGVDLESEYEVRLGHPNTQ